MKRTMVAGLVALMCAGCAVTPKPVMKAGNMAMDGMAILEQNTIIIVDGYVDKVLEAYTQGLMAWFNAQVKMLTDVDGKVDIESYNRLTASIAQRMAENRSLLEDEKNQVMIKLAQQFAIVRNFQYLVNEYNAAVGIPPETMQALMDTTVDILNDMQTARNESEAASGSNGSSVSQVDWMSAIEQIGRGEYAQILQRMREAAQTNLVESNE